MNELRFIVLFILMACLAVFLLYWLAKLIFYLGAGLLHWWLLLLAAIVGGVFWYYRSRKPGN